MAAITYYYGNESICEFGYQGESNDKTDCTTAATPTESLRYIQELSVTINPNIETDKFLNSGSGRNYAIRTQGVHDAKAKMKFWISKDAGQTDAQEFYFLKMPIDGTNTDVENLYTIPPTTNEFGSDYLKVFTIEAGYNKTDNITATKLTGCIVEKETMHLEMGKKCEWNWDIQAIKASQITSFAAGNIAESTEYPFNWGDVKIAYGDAGATATLDGCEMFEHVITNEVTKEYDLSNATSVLTPTHYTTGMRKITGTFRIKLNTETHNGQDLWEDLMNDASGEVTPTEGVVLKDFNVRMYIDGTYYVDYTYHDVVLGEIDHPVTSKGVVRLTIPWTALAVVCVLKAHASNSEPTGWS